MIPAPAFRDTAIFKRYAARQFKAHVSGRHPYKREFWKLAMRLGRLPTTHDQEFWDLPGWDKGVTS